MVLVVDTLCRIWPPRMSTVRKFTVTWSTRYCVDSPMPRKRAPTPPVRTLLSNATMPPSISTDAPSSGGTCTGGVPADCGISSARTILRSVSRFCRFSRSTGMNQPESCSARISIDEAPCVTAVEKELSGAGLYWPVWSRMPYTATAILPFGAGRASRSRVMAVSGVSWALARTLDG